MGLHVSKHIHGNKETAYSFLSKHTFGDALGGVTTPMIVIPGQDFFFFFFFSSFFFFFFFYSFFFFFV